MPDQNIARIKQYVPLNKKSYIQASIRAGTTFHLESSWTPNERRPAAVRGLDVRTTNTLPSFWQFSKRVSEIGTAVRYKSAPRTFSSPYSRILDQRTIVIVWSWREHILICTPFVHEPKQFLCFSPNHYVPFRCQLVKLCKIVTDGDAGAERTPSRRILCDRRQHSGRNCCSRHSANALQLRRQFSVSSHHRDRFLQSKQR